MSNVFGALSSFGPIVGDSQSPYALITGSNRSIGTLIADVTVEEMHRDTLQITLHPVETGAPITDHAFMMPATVEIRCGWSDCNGQAAGYVKTVYQQLLKLQSSRKPFDVSTGKRQYKNMLIASLQVRTDESSEYALMVSAMCQEILLTTVTTGPGSPNSDGNQAIKTDPKTATNVTAANAEGSGYLKADANNNVSWSSSTPDSGLKALSGGAEAGTALGVTQPTMGQGMTTFATPAPAGWEATAQNLAGTPTGR